MSGKIGGLRVKLGNVYGVKRGDDGFGLGWVWVWNGFGLGLLEKGKSKNENERIQSKYKRVRRGR